jgi:serine/threonine-protein kinase
VRNAPALSLSPEMLSEVERSLSRHVGPLATLLVKRTQGEAATIEDFFRALAENIPDADEQQAFMKKMATVKPKVAAADTIPDKPKTAPIATRSAFTPETLATAEKQLASYVGPLARILIKQAAESSGNLKELYTQLASHIDSDEERKAFLATLPR